MFVAFKKTCHDSKKYAFEKIIMWNLLYNYLDTEVKKVWDKNIDVLKNDTILNGKIKSKGRENNFPKMSQNPICHVRPHGSDTKTVGPITVPDKVTGATVFTRQ